jgi:hypothetical protein
MLKCLVLYYTHIFWTHLTTTMMYKNDGFAALCCFSVINWSIFKLLLSRHQDRFSEKVSQCFQCFLCMCVSTSLLTHCCVHVLFYRFLCTKWWWQHFFGIFTTHWNCMAFSGLDYDALLVEALHKLLLVTFAAIMVIPPVFVMLCHCILHNFIQY